MLNDTCLSIRQIKIRQPQKISNLPNFDPSKYTRYMVCASHTCRLSSTPVTHNNSKLFSNDSITDAVDASLSDILS